MRQPPEQVTVSPRDVLITVYGRKPVLEALTDTTLILDKVLVAQGAHGRSLRAILDAATARGVPVHRVSAHRVRVLAGNGRHDQGVLADVVAPRMRVLDQALPTLGSPAALLVLDAITNPANVGMILRSATAAGLDGVVLPRRGVPAIDPLVVKASAGVAFRAPVLRASTAEQACGSLRRAGFAVLGLSGSAPDAAALFPRDGQDARTGFDAAAPRRVAYVLGNESSGLSASVIPQLTGWVSIPMAGGVESLNVAAAAAVVCFEWAKRRHDAAQRSALPHQPGKQDRNQPRNQGRNQPRKQSGARGRARR